MGWQDGTPIAAPAWQAGAPIEPDMTPVRRHFEGVRTAHTFDEFLDAGWQQSVTGLATRQRVPDVALDQEAPVYGRIAASLATIAGDLPAMVAGFAAGAPAGGAVGGAAGSVVPVAGNVAGAALGGVVGGFAGAGALPAGLRAAMMEAYEKGGLQGAGDFVDRALRVAWETAKGGTVGAAMGGAGIAAKAALPAATATLTRGAVITGAEVTAMATVASGLEGKLPEPQDFVDAAVLVGGLKGAAAVGSKLRTIYARTGRQPAEVLGDAARDPALAAELRSEAPMIEIPEAYRPFAIAESARSAVPDYRSNEAAALDLAAVMQRPFAEIPRAKGEPAEPTHVNYNYINSSEEAAGALSRLSEIYERRITTQRRGEVSWEQTSAEAGRLLSDTLGGADVRLVMPREPGTAAGAAEILARKQLTIGAAEDMAVRAKAYLEKGTSASSDDTAAFIASIERAALIQSEFLGARAEAGRALNVLKSTARDAERAKEIQKVVKAYGGDPVELAHMVTALDNPTAALKFAAQARKATVYEKLMEWWKAVGMLSGPITQARNILGNTSFMVTRPLIDAVAAGFGKMHAGERVVAMEPVARIIGNLQGTIEAAKAAGEILRIGEEVGARSRVEQHIKAIEGVKGEIIRLPFRFLSAGDTFFRVLNESGEAYALAVRQATMEGLHPLTGEFRGRVAQLRMDPTPEMAKAMAEAGQRFTFQAELGKFGQDVQRGVRVAHLEVLAPFIKTPFNIQKETMRLSPFAIAIGEWRGDVFAKGGAARDKALAELAVGTSLMGVFFMYAIDGRITGAGPPDPAKRAVWLAAGNQPYSWKWGNEWYSYQGWGPVTTLAGMAADMAIAWDAMDRDQHDQVPKILAVAFANAVTSQTALMGMTNLVNVTSDPTRYGPRFFQGLASPAVPAFVAQLAAMNDPFVRQVDSMVEQLMARTPGMRETLLTKRDVFGEPIQTKERLGFISPITITEESTDKVRTEAARLGVSVAKAPKKTHVGRGTGKLGDVELTPEQRDVFATVSGRTAHDILEPLVNSPQWDTLPDRAKKLVYSKVFAGARQVGAHAALSPEERAVHLQGIVDKLLEEQRP